MKKIMNRLVFSLAIISFSFCGSVSADVVDRIVAIVNNDIVTLVQLNKESLPYIKNIEASGYSDEKKQEMMQDITKKILNRLVDSSLTQQEAKKYNIMVSDAEIDNAVENLKKEKALTLEELEKALGQEGLTLTEYRETIKKQILQARLINYAVKSKVVITESDIKKRYEIDADQYSGKKKYHLRNILMDNEDEIKKIKKQLDENKEFILLAKQYSIAPNASDGGDLGIFDIHNFSEAIKERISRLTKGEHTDFISTAQGFQIFYIQDIVLEGRKTYEQAHDEIRGILYREQVEKQFKTWLESLKKNAHIKIML
ncbi:SurA N-terminal domain-containing protein [Desulfobacula phenolica]|uniref:Periplasmic chaperone for outer membrane proteins SurA n=1 Tax=Desulfobacula phenolica TaxID=90732 RepID=A0A1H2EUM3_9BACT|nr:SurA N-terminal domain-containing protein [Desulfobacula phenolica]SDT98761.1 periplasmic chaperone for outer membrane proteins SurA [Desulfobacula phenolica]